MIGLGTNVLLRYLANDDPRQSPIAVRFIERTLTLANPGFVSLVTLAELVWVLRTRFQATKAEVVTAIEHVLGDAHLKVQDEDAVWLALELYEELAVDLADALIASVGQQHGCTHTVSFDRAATRMVGVQSLA